MHFDMKRHPILSRTFKGLAVAIASFVGFGTVAALWENPLFIRMTPAGDFEIALLTLLSILLGVYVGIRRPFCPAKTATVKNLGPSLTASPSGAKFGPSPPSAA